jgi:hypothetical protein
MKTSYEEDDPNGVVAGGANPLEYNPNAKIPD